jgi:hypothetical protein
MLAVVFLGVILLAAGVLVLAQPASTRHAARLDYGQAVQIDDFAFAATNSEQAQQIGDQRAWGMFYIITLKVMNRALRVPFQFRPEMARLDVNGVEYKPVEAARQAWFESHSEQDACAAQIGAGSECSTVVVYDVPPGTQAPLLAITFGDGVLRVADAILYGNRVIQLK